MKSALTGSNRCECSAIISVSVISSDAEGTSCSSGVAAGGGRTSVVTSTVSGCPMCAGDGANKRLLGNPLSVSVDELSVTLVPAVEALVSVATVA